MDWSEAPTIPAPNSEGGGETKWVVPEKFFDQFGEVLDTVPPLPGEEALYGQFRVLMDAAARDPEIKKGLVEAAVETEEPERPEALLPGDQEQDFEAQRRWLAHAVRRRRVAGRGEGIELAPGTGRPFLALHPRVLGQARHPRRLVEAAGHSESGVEPPAPVGAHP